MTLQPPKALAPQQANDNPLNAALEHEILAEKAATYGRLLKRLEEALAELREAEGVDSPLTAVPSAARTGLREGGLTGRRPFGLASPGAIADAMPAGSDAVPHGQGTADIHEAEDNAVTGTKETERPSSGREARPNGHRPVRARPRRPEPGGRGIAASDKNQTAVSDKNKTGPNTERDHLLAAAGEALWHVIIQRDLCGFRNHQGFMDELGVPAAVRFRMGPARQG